MYVSKMKNEKRGKLFKLLFLFYDCVYQKETVYQKTVRLSQRQNTRNLRQSIKDTLIDVTLSKEKAQSIKFLKFQTFSSKRRGVQTIKTYKNHYNHFKLTICYSCCFTTYRFHSSLVKLNRRSTIIINGQSLNPKIKFRQRFVASQSRFRFTCCSIVVEFRVF